MKPENFSPEIGHRGCDPQKSEYLRPVRVILGARPYFKWMMNPGNPIALPANLENFDGTFVSSWGRGLYQEPPPEELA